MSSMKHNALFGFNVWSSIQMISHVPFVVVGHVGSELRLFFSSTSREHPVNPGIKINGVFSATLAAAWATPVNPTASTAAPQPIIAISSTVLSVQQRHSLV
eukprot:m.433508 g.433508  ORF g.433508 m.433508 type:complete len:101 (+) comp17583_c0_seq1:6006-6308(+)